MLENIIISASSRAQNLRLLEHFWSTCYQTKECLTFGRSYVAFSATVVLHGNFLSGEYQETHHPSVIPY